MNRKPLQINDKHGEMLIIIDPTMSQDNRRTLVDRLATACSPNLQHTDTKADGFQNVFSAVHYTHYNRYSVQVRSLFLVPNVGLILKLMI